MLKFRHGESSRLSCVRGNTVTISLVSSVFYLIDNIEEKSQLLTIKLCSTSYFFFSLSRGAKFRFDRVISSERVANERLRALFSFFLLFSSLFFRHSQLRVGVSIFRIILKNRTVSPSPSGTWSRFTRMYIYSYKHKCIMWAQMKRREGRRWRGNCFGVNYDRPSRSAVLLFTRFSGSTKALSFPLLFSLFLSYILSLSLSLAAIYSGKLWLNNSRYSRK